MNPLVKKVMAGLAIKEVIDRVQAARQPQQSFAARNKGKALWAAILGGVGYLYKAGKLDPVVNQAKGLMGKSGSSTEPAAYPTGSTYSTPSTSTTPTSSSTTSTTSSDWNEREKEFQPTSTS